MGAGGGETIISGRMLLPSWRQSDLIEAGALLIEDDTILAVGTRDNLTRTYPQAVRFHEPHGLIMPGLVNSFAHLAPACPVAGDADIASKPAMPEPGWCETNNDPGYRHDLILLRSIAMLKSGTTSVCSAGETFGELSGPAAESGLRSWICSFSSAESSTTGGGADHSLLAGNLGTYSEHLVERTGWLPAMAFGADASTTKATAAALLQNKKQVTFVQLPQGDEELQEFVTLHGMEPIPHLHRCGLLNDRIAFIPGTALEESALAMIERCGAAIVCTGGTGPGEIATVARLKEISSRAISLGLGSGAGGNRSGDMFELMNRVAKIAKAMNSDPTVMSAETTLRAATIGGAELLGAGGEIGTLAAGKKADLIIIDLHRPHLTPLFNVVSHLVYSARGADVVHAYIGGRMVMQDRRLLSIDEAALLDRVRSPSVP